MLVQVMLVQVMLEQQPAPVPWPGWTLDVQVSVGMKNHEGFPVLTLLQLQLNLSW